MPNKAHSVTYSRCALTALVASTAQRSFYQLLLFSTSGNSFPSKQQGPAELFNLQLALKWGGYSESQGQ